LTFVVFFAAFACGASGEPAAAALSFCFLVAIVRSAPSEPTLPARNSLVVALSRQALADALR
jgi:hypothetical protein